MRLFANPYDTSKIGFFFETMEEFTERYNLRLPVEEYEIEVIDGETWEVQIASVAGVNQANLAKFFELMEELEGEDDWTKAATWFRLYNNHRDVIDIVGDLNSECVAHECEGSPRSDDAALGDYAYQLAEDTGDLDSVPEHYRNYIDFEAIGRDRLSGDVTVDDFDGTTYIFYNHG